MELSSRERYVSIAAVLAVGAMALDRLAISPLLNERDATAAELSQLTVKLAHCRSLIDQQRLLVPRWGQMLREGLKGDAAEAESQVLHALRDWSEQAGISLSLLKPDRLTGKSPLPEIAFQASGTGTMRSVAMLLWRVRTAHMPIRVTEVQIAARREGLGDLSFQFRLSTVCAPFAAAPPAAASRPASTGGGR